MAQETSPNNRRWNEVRREVLLAVLLLCLLTYMVSRWVLWPVKISGDSMEPTYADGQPNFINRLAYVSARPQRGDVVALRVGKELLIKRVIGLPGEKIEFHRDVVFINGEPLSESYPLRPLIWILPSEQLGENDYFVMGDNRAISQLGAVPRESIIGKAMF